MFFDHTDRNTHPFGNLGLGKAINDMQDKCFPASWWQGIDDPGIRLYSLPGGQGLFWLKVLWRMLHLGNSIEVIMLPQC